MSEMSQIQTQVCHKLSQVLSQVKERSSSKCNKSLGSLAKRAETTAVFDEFDRSH